MLVIGSTFSTAVALALKTGIFDLTFTRGILHLRRQVRVIRAIVFYDSHYISAH